MDSSLLTFGYMEAGPPALCAITLPSKGLHYVLKSASLKAGSAFGQDTTAEAAERAFQGMSANVAIPLFPILRSVLVTKESLGIQTRKSILYLDQHFFSSVYKGKDSRWGTAMQRITELLDLQLVAVPYSSTHETETDFWKHRDDLLNFIQRVARGHHFEPYYRVEKTQILKAFQAYLANAPASYATEERDALPSNVHDWDGDYSVSVSLPESGVERKRRSKQRAIAELVDALSSWATSKNTFEQDIELELRDSAHILMESYRRKTARLYSGDFSALLDSPISASIVEDMAYVLSVKEMQADAARVIPSFFKSEHFAKVPSQQLSARLFSTFKKRVREGAYPNPERAREKLRGFLFDVQHAATYLPYCDAFFTDKFMADLLSDPLVGAQQTFGCKVFSVSKTAEFFSWLEDVKSHMTADHADGLTWAYPNYRSKATGTGL